MRRSKTDFSGWTPEQIREHRNAEERRRRAENPEKYRAYSRAYYTRDPQRKMQRDAKRIAANPEPRRATVRRSKHKKPWRTLLEAAERRAAKKGIPYTLTAEWAEATYTGLCALTGRAFEVGSAVGKHGPTPLSPSLDQIVAAAGYTPGNCRFILHSVNMFKGTMSDAEMFALAKALPLP